MFFRRNGLLFAFLFGYLASASCTLCLSRSLYSSRLDSAAIEALFAHLLFLFVSLLFSLKKVKAVSLFCFFIACRMKRPGAKESIRSIDHEGIEQPNTYIYVCFKLNYVGIVVSFFLHSRTYIFVIVHFAKPLNHSPLLGNG